LRRVADCNCTALALIHVYTVVFYHFPQFIVVGLLVT
jgi:hypothetical protein